VPNVIAAQEVPAGVLIGVWLVQEVPGPATLIGGLIALAGVIAVITATREARGRSASPT